MEDHVEKYLVDEMLIRLGRWLRLIGADAANPDGLDDRGLMEKAKAEDRVLITRDRVLKKACDVSGIDCILIGSNSISEQLKEMERRGVPLRINPSMCTICNSPLIEAPGHAPDPALDAWICESCGKVYWKGSQWRKMEETLAGMRGS